MIEDWQKLSKMTGGREVLVEKVKLKDRDIRIEGTFELPPLAKLPMEDQIFAATFIKVHGSIKEMERLFGISYPTVKNRLNKIAKQLSFVQVDVHFSSNTTDILDRLDRGEITVEQAMEELS